MNLAFVGIVVAAAVVGGASAVSYGSELRTVDLITLVEGRLGSDVTALRLVDGELRFTVTIDNPTDHPLELRGSFIRVFQGEAAQLAYGAGQRLDDGPTRVPARGTLTARYAVSLSPSGADRLREAFRAGPVRVSVFHSLALRGRSFEIARADITVEEPEVA